MKPLCIVVVGRIGSGKSTIAKEVAKKFSMEFLEMSDVIRDITGRDRSTIRHNGLTADVVGVEVLKRMDLEKNYVVSGVRQAGIVKKLKGKYRVEVLKLDFTPGERQERMMTRGEEVSIDDLNSQDKLDSDLGLDAIMDRSEYFSITNSKWSIRRNIEEIAYHLTQRHEELR